MNIPKISIITIAYNSEKTIERTIKSVIQQNYSNLEYIIIDGGSTDGTLDIIRKYETKITVWQSEPDNGISNAFNKGIRLATGEIIGIINSDDGLMPNALTNLSKSYEVDVDVYRGKVLLWKEDTGIQMEEIPSMHLSLCGLNYISHQSTFVTKKAYLKYGMYDESCRYVMDFDLLLRLQNAGTKWKFVDEVLAYYTLGGLTFTEFTQVRLDEIKMIIRRHGGSRWTLCRYEFQKRARIILIKLVGKDNIMRIRKLLK